MGLLGRCDDRRGHEGGQKLVGRGSVGPGGDEVLDLVEERREGACREQVVGAGKLDQPGAGNVRRHVAGRFDVRDLIIAAVQ